MSDSPAIWSIGHSNHAWDDFAALLRAQGIEVVVDVRSYPYSRFAPQFNREDLEAALNREGFKYLFLGDELGGRPSRGEHYDAEGHALYEIMAAEPSFEQAIERLLKGARSHRLALLCSEGRPDECHRRLLVGKVLTARGATLHHVLPSGEVAIERAVSLGDADADQQSLFGENEPPWRSTQSVSRRRRLRTSSAA